MEIKISEDILKFTELSDKEITLEIAIMLYKKQKLTLGQASLLTKLHQYQFQKELTKRNIPLNYDVESFREDLINLGYSKNL
jgi:predicted HTH domain antitoxin